MTAYVRVVLSAMVAVLAHQSSAYVANRIPRSSRSAAMPLGTKWTFSGELRTEDIRSEKGGVRVRIIFLHKAKPNTGTRPPLYTEFVTGSTDWRTFELGFEVPKKNRSRAD